MVLFYGLNFVMELIFEVFIFEPETGYSYSVEFDSVVKAYEYASELKRFGFCPKVARYYRVKV